MQLEKLNRAVISSGTMEVAKATIKSSRKVFDMFSDQTYENKPVAICRELVANGIDAHIAAGTPDVPVEVIMPTELEPEFKVKDHGIGMAHEFVMGPFMAYTDGSTKDKSNDQIGGFGIGSKSPFAYCDQFTLRVVHEGVLSIYTMFRDEEGIPSVGLQGQTTTDEHNGVEVSFPVELDDMEQFRDAAQEALQYFHPLPLVHNGTLNPPDYSHISSTGVWAMRPTSGPLGVIMGGVRYPVATNSLTWEVRRNEKVAPLLDYGLDITLPIGACDVAMSREGLSYTEKTSKAIEAALTTIVDEVAATFATMFDSYTTEWAAKRALGKEIKNLGGYSYTTSGRAGMLRQYAQWKGAKLTHEIAFGVTTKWNGKENETTYPQGFQKGTAWVVQTWQGRRGGYAAPKFKALGTDIQSLTPQQYDQVFLDDMPLAAKSRTAARVREYIEANPSSGGKIVLRSSNQTDKATNDKLIEFLGSPEVILLSTLPEPARNIAVRNGSPATSVRPKIRMFTCSQPNDRYGNTILNLSPSRAKRDAVKEIPYADQPTEGILVQLEAWGLTPEFRQQMRTGVVKWDELHFVNKSDAPKLKGTKFKKFEDVFKRRFNKEVKKYPKLGEWLAIADDENLKGLFNHIQPYRPYFNLTPEQQKTTFGKIVQLYDDYVVPLTSELRAFAKNANIGAKTPDGIDTEALLKAYETDHPFLVQLFELVRWHHRGDHSQQAALLLNNL